MAKPTPHKTIHIVLRSEDSANTVLSQWNEQANHRFTSNNRFGSSSQGWPRGSLCSTLPDGTPNRGSARSVQGQRLAFKDCLRGQSFLRQSAEVHTVSGGTKSHREEGGRARKPEIPYYREGDRGHRTFHQDPISVGINSKDQSLNMRPRTRRLQPAETTVRVDLPFIN